MIVDALVIKARITWPNGRPIKQCADILRRASEVQSDRESYQTATQSLKTWRMTLISVTANHPSHTVMKATTMVLMMTHYEFHSIYASC
jgi:uncharacterized protein (UPF0548 family)